MVLNYDCDTSYVNSAVENKKRVIAFENQCASEVKSILDNFETELVNMINLFVQSQGRNNLLLADKERRQEFVANMKKVTDSMQLALLEKEIESTMQAYELAVMDQYNLLKDYIDVIAEQPDSPIQVTVGGEQDAYVVARLTKPAFTSKKAKELASKKRVKKTVDERIGKAITEFEEEFMKAFDEAVNLNKNVSSMELIAKMKKSLETKVRKQAEFSIRSGIQTTEETAYQDIWDGNEEISPTEFQRIEVLDKKVCLTCMFIDSTYNEKPLGLIHYNCRGIDVPVYYDKKGKRIKVDGAKYSKRRLSFDERFEKLTQKEQRRMLGKGKFNLYQSGKLKPSEFISDGETLTLKEAQKHVALKSIRKMVKTPQSAEKVMSLLEKGFSPISKMDSDELKAYANVLGEQRKVISFVPKSKFTKKKPYSQYISELDEKKNLVKLRYKELKGGET